MYYYLAIGASDEIFDNENHTDRNDNYNKFSFYMGNMIRHYGGYSTFISSLFYENSDIREEIDRRTDIGRLVGQIFNHIIETNINITTVSNKFFTLIQEHYSEAKDHTFALTSRNFRNNIWPLYKSVAHLWGATHLVSAIHKAINPEYDSLTTDLLDCPPLDKYETYKGLVGFLLIAEQYRQVGVRTFTLRRGPVCPVLDAETAHEFKLPPGIGFHSSNLK